MWKACGLHIIGILKLWIVFYRGHINIEGPQGNVGFCRIIVMKKRLKSKKAVYGFFLCLKNLDTNEVYYMFCLISIIYI